MKSEKQGAAEWLREKAQSVRRAKGFGCKELMASEFGESCDGRRCADCYADLFERIAGRIEAERALPDGIEWPRFEDGELVKVGDTVGNDEPFTAREIAFEPDRWLIKASSRSAFGCFHGAFGERVKRPAPKVLAADGAPIEVGDTVYLRSNGREGKVVGFYEDKGETWVGETWVSVSYELGSDRMTVNTEGKALTHERPDSWKRIEEDAYCLVMSEYIETPEEDVRDIVRRAKALAKVGEVE